MAEDVFNGSDMTEPTPAELGMDVGSDEGALEDSSSLEDLDGGGDAGDDDGGAVGGHEQVSAPQRGGGRRPAVPLPEVQKLRAQLKQYEEERSGLLADREQKIRYEERLNMLRAQQEARARQEQAARDAEAARKQAEADPMPDREIDPEGFNEWRIRQLEAQVNATREEHQAWQQTAAQREEQGRRMAVVSRVAQEYTAFENRFALSQPDYGQAFQYVANWFAGFHSMRGVTAADLPARLERERAELIRDCVQMNPQTGEYQWVRDPAQVIYELAWQLGYGNGGQGAPEGADDGMQAQPQPQVQQRPSSPRAQQLARSVNAAQRSGAPGRAGASPRGRMTLEDAVNLEDDEFARLLDSEPGMMRQLMGG